MESLPSDGPVNVLVIWTQGDENCIPRSLSTSYAGDDSMHIEICARIVIEAVLRKNDYLTDSCLSRGSSIFREGENLPFLYAKYSDHYVSGQRMTVDTLEYLYCREVHDCTKINSYMGLWQLAQAATALNIPIKSIYPEEADQLMRLDFHRTFLPNQL